MYRERGMGGNQTKLRECSISVARSRIFAYRALREGERISYKVSGNTSCLISIIRYLSAKKVITDPSHTDILPKVSHNCQLPPISFRVLVSLEFTSGISPFSALPHASLSSIAAALLRIGVITEVNPSLSALSHCDPQSFHDLHASQFGPSSASAGYTSLPGPAHMSPSAVGSHINFANSLALAASSAILGPPTSVIPLTDKLRERP